MTRAKEAAKVAAIDTLRGIVKPGDTLNCVLRHVSRSGMYRLIDVYKLTCENDDGRISKQWLSRLVAAATGNRFDERKEAVGVSGVGMDMGFALVYELGWALYGEDGWECTGDRCPNNSHNNEPRGPRGPGVVHTEGGYSLKHEWL